MIQGIESRLGNRGESEERATTRVESGAAASARARNRIPGPDPDAMERLVRKLAADHLRDLRDDGLTVDYVARMYGVSAERMEILYGDLLPQPPR